ncbi:MAG: acyltransferase [Bacteroides sp.]|nr:acyltransferase [Bacteroides sp.]
MIDILTTALIPIILAAIVLLPDAKGKVTESNFFNKDYTTALKGLAAIVVIFVHVPADNGNRLQDAIGSFAYVAVTYFFLVSAYGMQLAAENKAGYLNSFWKKRLASLLIPMVVINIVCYAIKYFLSDSPEAVMLVYLDRYVAVLLSYCLWFWCLEMLGNHFGWTRGTIDIINISGVIISSLVLYFFISGSGWCFERIGFIWGLLLFRYFPSFLNWLKKNEKPKRIIFLLASLALGIAYLKYKSTYFFGEYLLKIMLGFVILVGMSLWSYRMNFSKKILLFLGGISYEIYLLHVFVLEMLAKHLPMPSGLLITTAIALTVILAYIINLIAKPLVEKARRVKWSEA